MPAEFADSLEKLSPRERHVVSLAVAGLSDAAIRTRLGISEGSLSTYWSRVRRKLGSLSRVELATRITNERAERHLAQLRGEYEALLSSMKEEQGASNHFLGGRMQAIVRDMPDALIAVDRDGRIIIANLAADDLLGHPRGTLLGRHLRDLIPTRYHGWHAEQRHYYEDHPERRTMGRDGVTVAVKGDGEELELITTMNLCQDAGKDLVVCIMRPFGDRPVGNNVPYSHNGVTA